MSPIEHMRLRAFDLSERTVRRSRTSAVRRLTRWRQRAFLILQMSVTAGIAWFVARHIPGHGLPFFAPVAAIVTLGISFGQRLRRAVEVAIGVAVGVGVGELWRTYFGVGVWQIMVVCALAMSIATLLGAGQLMIIQSGVQSIIVTVLASNLGYGVNRWLDAVIGCALALVVATVAPSSPLRRPGALAAEILSEMADALNAAATALRTMDTAGSEAVLAQARAGEAGLAAFDLAAREGLAVVRLSPFQRRHRRRVTALADLYDPLDHATRNLRVLARRCAVAVWRGEAVPEAYMGLLDELAGCCRAMGSEMNADRLPARVRDRLIRLGATTSHLALSEEISGVVILAQVRSMTADLLELTGLDYQHARDLIPEMD